MRRQGGHTQPRRSLRTYAAAFLLLAFLALALSACADSPSTLEPQSDRANRVADVWWILFSVGMVVWVVVIVALFIALFHRRRQVRDGQSDPVGLVLIAGAAVPVVILSGVLGLAFWSLPAVIPDEADAEEGDVRIEVTGFRWWWEFHYPDEGFTTANELHIPAGERVVFEITSADVIHSFWVPQLQGKLDAIPGRQTTLVLTPDTPGAYRGMCAEFCGVQHTNMSFLVIVDSPEDYAAWAEAQSRPAEQSTDPQVVHGQQIFLGAGCVYCHAVEGTSASGQLGPDLTHLASREEIVGGVLDNTPANLRAWIIDPQDIKFGNLMPPTEYDSEADLEALIAYLESLE